MARQDIRVGDRVRIDDWTIAGFVKTGLVVDVDGACATVRDDADLDHVFLAATAQLRRIRRKVALTIAQIRQIDRVRRALIARSLIRPNTPLHGHSQ